MKRNKLQTLRTQKFFPDYVYRRMTGQLSSKEKQRFERLIPKISAIIKRCERDEIPFGMRVDWKPNGEVDVRIPIAQECNSALTSDVSELTDFQNIWNNSDSQKNALISRQDWNFTEADVEELKKRIDKASPELRRLMANTLETTLPLKMIPTGLINQNLNGGFKPGEFVMVASGAPYPSGGYKTDMKSYFMSKLWPNRRASLPPGADIDAEYAKLYQEVLLGLGVRVNLETDVEMTDSDSKWINALTHSHSDDAATAQVNDPPFDNGNKYLEHNEPDTMPDSWGTGMLKHLDEMKKAKK